MPNKRAVLFDLDGTFVDTAEDFVEVVQALCARHSRAAPSDVTIRNSVSDGARALVTLAFDLPANDPQCEPLREELLDIYEDLLGSKSRLFPGIEATLATIDRLNLAWGIVTNKPRRFAEPLMQCFEFRPNCGVLVCPDDVTHTKPDPEPLLKAAAAVGAKPKQCIYVGDHLRDIEAGKNAGMLTVAAAYGYVANRSEAQAWQADNLVDHASELSNIIVNFVGA